MYKKIRIYIAKTLITVIITLIVLILIKSSSSFKNNFYKQVYDTNFSFTKISNLYNKYFGKIVEIPKDPSEPVFNEKLSYNKQKAYYDGVSLSVGKNYLVPIQESGLVVFIGEKEHYGNVVIIQQINGIDMWYGNINHTDVNLYDYVSKGTPLGECDDQLYLLFKQNGEVLNYEKYL